MHRYILKNPGEPAVVGDIDLNLKQLQTFVGGYVENLPDFYKPDGATWDVYMNEEGLLQSLPVNLLVVHKTPILGPVIVLAHDHEGETRSLTPDEEAAALTWLAQVAA